MRKPVEIQDVDLRIEAMKRKYGLQDGEYTAWVTSDGSLMLVRRKTTIEREIDEQLENFEELESS